MVFVGFANAVQDIDMDSLVLLTDEDLASIGMKLGPRKALLKAMADTDKVRRLSHPRDISHQDVKRTMSKQFRTGKLRVRYGNDCLRAHCHWGWQARNRAIRV